MWLSGMKSEAIAAELGMTRGPLTRRVRTLGLPKRRAGASGISLTPSLWPFIVEWARLGFTPMDIAVGIGCTKPHIIAEMA